MKLWKKRKRGEWCLTYSSQRIRPLPLQQALDACCKRINDGKLPEFYIVSVGTYEQCENMSRVLELIAEEKARKSPRYAREV